MIQVRPDPGSFRDPGGRVFLADDDRVLRAVMTPNATSYRAVRDEGLYQTLVERGLMLPLNELPADVLGSQAHGVQHVLEHPRIPFISYPYEWSFATHRRAALLHLDLHLAALEAGFTLSDASAYNVQFQGTRPVFIDHLSLRPYRDGELWAGHRQFCMQFLNPLLLWSWRQMAPNAWFRGSLEGIAPEEIARLLPLRGRMSWTVLTHVVAQAALQRRALDGERTPAKPAPSRGLPRAGLVGMLEGLRDYIARLTPPAGKTVWSDYDRMNSYGDVDVAAKRALVREMVAAVRPGLMFDIGCNSGDYAEAAFMAGAGHIVGFDFDHAALDRAHARFDATGQSFLPLWLDAANPSPSQGWSQSERPGLRERSRAEALIALAFIHHIVIGRNVPLGMALDWLLGLAPVGIVEFPSKTDPMVQRLLAHRDDIFPDYNERNFLAALGQRARLVRTQRLARNGRLLVWYSRA